MTIFRTLTKLSLSLVLLGQLIGGNVMAADPILHKPKVIIFDVNETLLDLDSMRESIGDALGGREDLLPLWFSTMLHHSLVSTAIGDYQDFGKIGVASLINGRTKQ